ncbi:MAG: hypothetical protein J0M12_01545 [Deltaproteobacteria bacterium]|nr:hypothetical protein [Deltaproteobacteria bacterium]
MKTRVHTIAMACFALSVCGAGCSSTTKEWKPDQEKKAFAPIYHQVPPQPVYNRLRYVNLPSTMPPAEITTNAKEILPVFHLDLKNATMEEAARALAATARFDSYCSSLIAERRISINRLGTIDELADEIETSADITVQVDRENHTVRFLSKLAPQPEFLDSASTEVITESKVLNNEVSANEHQSVN